MVDNEIVVDGQYKAIEPSKLDENKIANVLAGIKSKGTIALYQNEFQNYIEFCDLHNFSWADYTSFAKWRTELVNDARYLAVRTINKKLSAVRAVVAEAANHGHISQADAAAFKMVKGVSLRAEPTRQRPNRGRVRITPEKMEEMCNAPDTKTAEGLMHFALLMTMRFTGLRVSEVVNLRKSQISFYTDEESKNGWIVYVMGKNATEAQPIELGAKAKAAIDDWVYYRKNVLKIDCDYIFTASGGHFIATKPISAVRVWQVVQKYAKVVGLDGIKPHDFRRYVGTQLAAKEDMRAAQKQLRHKSISTTADNYVLDGIKVGIVDSVL